MVHKKDMQYDVESTRLDLSDIKEAVSGNYLAV
jgi:hypothetical protein